MEEIGFACVRSEALDLKRLFSNVFNRNLKRCTKEAFNPLIMSQPYRQYHSRDAAAAETHVKHCPLHPGSLGFRVYYFYRHEICSIANIRILIHKNCQVLISRTWVRMSEHLLCGFYSAIVLRTN